MCLFFHKLTHVAICCRRIRGLEKEKRRERMLSSFVVEKELKGVSLVFP